jgi:hypothetical protein
VLLSLPQQKQQQQQQQQQQLKELKAEDLNQKVKSKVLIVRLYCKCTCCISAGVLPTGVKHVIIKLGSY